MYCIVKFYRKKVILLEDASKKCLNLFKLIVYPWKFLNYFSCVNVCTTNIHNCRISFVFNAIKILQQNIRKNKLTECLNVLYTHDTPMKISKLFSLRVHKYIIYSYIIYSNMNASKIASNKRSISLQNSTAKKKKNRISFKKSANFFIISFFIV